MPDGRIDPSCSQEAGIALIEVVVSALIAAIMVGAAITLLSSTGRASAEQRRHSQAFAIAQEDQARLRSMRLTELNGITETNTEQLGPTTFTVTSTAQFISDKSGTTTCAGGSASADYVQVGSSVTWSGMRPGASPVVIESIVSPVSGSLDPTAGGLALHFVNAENVPISGVGINGTGPSTFTGTTDSNGCSVFGGLPEGTYSMTPSLGAEYIDPNGSPPAAQSVTISSGTTQAEEYVYDRAATVEISFKVRNTAGQVVAANGDSVVAAATGLESGAKAFGTVGTFTSKLTANNVFPFNYPYTFYAGSCSTNSPEAGSASVTATPGGTTAATIQLPPLYLLVKNSKGTTAEKTSITGANVTLTDLNCSPNKTPVKRTYTTVAGGGLANVGVPWGTYEICASYKPSGSTSTRRQYAKSVVIHSLTGTSVTIDLNGTGSGTGTC